MASTSLSHRKINAEMVPAVQLSIVNIQFSMKRIVSHTRIFFVWDIFCFNIFMATSKEYIDFLLENIDLMYEISTISFL